MPGVKKLHQESENLNKKEWIRGHYFGCLCLLLGEGNALFAVPLILRVQDGLQQGAQQTNTLVEKMADICVGLAKQGSYIVLDSYFAAGNLLASFRQHKLHLITRVRINTVGKLPLPPLPFLRGRGRPPIWGKRIKLRTLFDDSDFFKSETVILYGRLVTVRYRTIDLYWDSPQDKRKVCFDCIALRQAIDSYGVGCYS